MRAFLAVFLALTSFAAVASAQKEPTSVRDYQLTGPSVPPGTPNNEQLRLLAYDAAGRPVLLILDGVTLSTRTANGNTVIEVRNAPAARSLRVFRFVDVRTTTTSPTLTIPAGAIFESLLVFRNGLLQSVEHDYTADAQARTITFLPTIQTRAGDIIHYYWLESQ